MVVTSFPATPPGIDFFSFSAVFPAGWRKTILNEDEEREQLCARRDTLLLGCPVGPFPPFCDCYLSEMGLC